MNNMCVYCDEIVNCNFKELKVAYKEYPLWSSDDKKFLICQYDDGFTLEYDSQFENYSMPIEYCPMCGRKLEISK